MEQWASAQDLELNMDMMMPNTMNNGNLLSGVGSDLANKIVKDGQKTLSSLIQQHVAEGYQTLTQMGVPVADAANHILGELVKMSPIEMGKSSGMAMAASNGTPPTGPSGPGNQPPQIPMVVRNDQSQVDPTISTSNQTTPPAPIQQVAPQQDGNALISQLLTAMQQNNPKILPSTLNSKQGFDANGNLQLGGLLDFQGTPLKNLGQAQELVGRKPMQIGDIQKVVTDVGGKQLEAQVVPANAAQKLAATGSIYQAKIDAAKAQLDSYKSDEDNYMKQLDASLAHPLQRVAGATGKNSIKTIFDSLRKVHQNKIDTINILQDLKDNPPDISGSQSSQAKSSPAFSRNEIVAELQRRRASSRG